MNEYVIMPHDDYKSACDTIRSISGKTDLIKSGDLSTEIALLNKKMFKKSTFPNTTNTWYREIAYGAGKFVAIPYNNTTVAYSNDGINWHEAKLPENIKNLQFITYGNDKFVAMSNTNKTVAYSSDGINWSSSTLPDSAPSSLWHSIAYGAGKFVAITSTYNQPSYSNYMYFNFVYSTDGINWSTSQLAISKTYSYIWNDITYGDGKFVIVSYNYENDPDMFVYSTDGINWTTINLPDTSHWIRVTYGNGKFVAISDINKTIAYSSDGINWTEITLPYTDLINITYGAGKFIALIRNSNTAICSSDGINWTEITLPYTDLLNITYGAGKFIASSSSNVAYCDITAEIV